MKSRILCVGDIHGRLGALEQVLDRSNFDYDSDTLIFLGDVCDGGPDTKAVIDKLLTIKNLIYIKGNHDYWMLDYINNKDTKELWVQQGGKSTLKSYGAKLFGASNIGGQRRIYRHAKIPQEHIKFLRSGKPYHIIDKKVFTHGGFDPTKPIWENDYSYLAWDRELIDFAKTHSVPGWDKVFVGHSSTLSEGIDKPIKRNNLWMLDTGCGHCGRLTIMDVETEEYWQSDLQPSSR